MDSFGLQDQSQNTYLHLLNLQNAKEWSVQVLKKRDILCCLLFNLKEPVNGFGTFVVVKCGQPKYKPLSIKQAMELEKENQAQLLLCMQKKNSVVNLFSTKMDFYR